MPGDDLGIARASRPAALPYMPPGVARLRIMLLSEVGLKAGL